ncbi:MAG: sigma-54-dependent transcriptional regulator [Chitinivibrionales bacterium]
MEKILIVDDEGKMRALLAMALDSKGYSVKEAESGEEALECLKNEDFDLIISDVRMEGIDGLELLKRVKSESPDTEFIVITAYADAKSGIEAMRNGAFQYIPKPFEMDEILMHVKNVLEKHSLREQLSTIKQSSKENSLDSISSNSKEMQEVVELAEKVAVKNSTVLITGESGTGKELIARGIYEKSGREPFIAVNCGAIPENLLESELFGHEKGSFTGAYEQKKGIFERSGEGTVFLDEIGELPHKLQVKLLRVIQEREFARVGGSERLKTGARVITASNKDLEKEVHKGFFREDLYYRLNVFPLNIPPLRRRQEDIPDLINRFLLKHRFTHGILDEAKEKLKNYSWPGNIRELENVIERAVIMAGNSTITPKHLPSSVREGKRGSNKPKDFTLPEEGIELDEIEKSLIIQALDKADWNKTEAARLLGISRRSIYSKMKSHNIEGE